MKDRALKMGIGGLAYGFIEKQPNIPTIPMLGRAGSIAVGAYFLGGQKPGLAQDVCLAAAVIAGYQLGRDGKISGDDD